MGYIKLKFNFESLQGKEIRWKVPEKKKRGNIQKKWPLKNPNQFSLDTGLR